MRDERWKEYIAAAELAWFKVFDAGKPTKLTTAEGTPLFRLPVAFDSRRKIYAYFRRWWGPHLASNMLCNLPLVERKGRLCVIGYDFPPISMTASSVQVVARRGKEHCLNTVLTGGLATEQVQYRVKYSQLHAQQMIVVRSGSTDDFRYHDCCQPAEE